MEYKATITVLWRVSWSQDEMGHQSKDSWFSQKATAEKLKTVPLGWYGSGGSISEKKFIDGEGMPSRLEIYSTPQEWIDDNLTMNQAKRYKLI